MLKKLEFTLLDENASTAQSRDHAGNESSAALVVLRWMS
jgi:hypothetical protein